jgi:hypothetical protein
MGYALKDIPRQQKTDIALQIRDNLQKRRALGSAEAGIDAFLPELADVTVLLRKHVAGKIGAVAAHAAGLAHVERADVDVDSWTRHIENFLSVEAHRRSGPHVEDARRLHRALFPAGLGFLDDRVADENDTCRRILGILRADEQKALLAAIRFPMSWLDELESALAASDAALADLTAAREEMSGHVGRGRDAEAVWVDVMQRLRKCIDARAKADEIEKKREGRELIAPLLNALQELRAQAAARATRRGKKGSGPREG